MEKRGKVQNVQKSIICSIVELVILELYYFQIAARNINKKRRKCFYECINYIKRVHEN